MTIDRRGFLSMAGLALGSSLFTLGRHAWAASAPAPVDRRLVVVMLRGAVDGLNVVVPHGDADYAAARPGIAIKPPGGDDGALDLDGHFGLHPALGALMPLWRQRRLAFVQACGSPDPTRSHFDAQDYMESGTPGVKMTRDGWMNRLLAVLPGPQGPTRAISLGATRPRILDGPQPSVNFPLDNNAGRPMAIDRPAVSAAFAALYAGNDAMSDAFRQGRSARQELTMDLSGDEQIVADNGAPKPDGFPATAARLARLMVKDQRIQLAFADLGGWDTHVEQGGATGRLANHLRPLGDGLAALAAGLGPRLNDTVIVVMSEFGRTVHENGDGGTDHGHGNVMWLMGGAVNGGQVAGDWPGLAPDRLYQNRDLAITTDFRSVLALVMERHLRLADAPMARVLPHAPKADPALGRLLRA